MKFFNQSPFSFRFLDQSEILNWSKPWQCILEIVIVTKSIGGHSHAFLTHSRLREGGKKKQREEGNEAHTNFRYLSLQKVNLPGNSRVFSSRASAVITLLRKCALVNTVLIVWM